jgi:hypothetical protein
VTNTFPEFVVALGAARIAARIQETMPQQAADDAFAAASVEAARTSAGHVAAAGARRPPVPLVGLRTAAARGAPAQPKSLTGAHGDNSARPLRTRAARIAILAVVATLVLVAAAIALLIVFLSPERTIGGHGTATFVPAVTTSSTYPVGPMSPTR